MDRMTTAQIRNIYEEYDQTLGPPLLCEDLGKVHTVQEREGKGEAHSLDDYVPERKVEG